jgi:hypothetical protein
MTSASPTPPVPQGSGGHGPELPHRRVCRHHALAHRQHLLRGPGQGPGAGTRRGQRYSELGDALLQLINPAVSDKYGLEITSFMLENVSVPPEVEQAIDKRSSMGAIGNLNDYVKYQMGQAMANGGEGAAAATIPATMAMGFGMAQEMMKGMQGGGAAGAPAAAVADPFSPAAAQAAQTPAAPAAAGLQVLTPPRRPRCWAWPKPMCWPKSRPATSRPARSAASGASPRLRWTSSCAADPQSMASGARHE